MAWRTIQPGEVDPGSPGTSELFQALKDNPEGIARAATGAPRVLTAALEPAAAGDVLVARLFDPSRESTSVADGGTAYPDETAPRHEAPGDQYGFTALVSGTVRVKLEHRVGTNDSSAPQAFARILKNGVEEVEWSTADLTTYQSRSYDLDVAPNDIVVIQQRVGGTTSGTDTTTAIWRNLGVYADSAANIAVAV